ncbi:MAG: thiamine pyrophosphate-binding protein, partial [Christensenellaceae bacterium]
MRVADYIMERLYAMGVHHLFFVPGSGCMHLTDALAKHTQLQGVSMHHEQAAAMAALSYAKYNMNFGACLVTTGCGGTNTFTGLLHAWQDNVPCMFIAGQAQQDHTVRNSHLPLRQFGRQEADILSLVEPITKYAVMIDNPMKTRYYFEKAVYMAKEGRPGPVWLDIPLDIQNALIMNPD